MEPLSKLNHHQHIHIILWQVSKLYLFLCDFCKKNVYSCKQSEKCRHKQPKLIRPFAVYHLFTQNLFILFAAFDLSSYPDNYYYKCNNKDNKDDSKGGIEHLFILVQQSLAFWTRQMKYRSCLSFGRSGSAVHLRLRLLLW